MDDKKVSKKFLIPAILAVFTLIALVFGATYAFFQVQTASGIFQARNVTADVPDVGIVTIGNAETSILLNMTREKMLENATYYGTNLGAVKTDTVQNIPIATLQSTVGNVTCDLSFDAEFVDNSLPANLTSTGLMLLSVGSNSYDLKTYNNNFSIDLSDILVTPTQSYINASLKYIVSTSVDQKNEAEKNLNMTLSLNTYSCNVAA